MTQENRHMKNTLTRRMRVPLLAAGVLVVGAAVAVPLAASAHTPDFQVSCTSALINLTNYPAGSTVSGTLDGVDLGTVTFGAEGYHGHTVLDPTVPHEWSIVVKSGDGDHRYDRTFAGKSDPACIPVVPPVETPTPEPTEPPVTETPTPEPTTPPTETPAPVVVPQIQDYITCKGGAFVLDNTGSTVPVTYTINDLPFTVEAGQAVHTDADGTLIQPNSDYAGYTIKAGERTWNFPSAGNCPTVPTMPEPTPPVETPVPSDEPTPPVTETPQPTEPASPSAQPTAPSPTVETSQRPSSAAAPVPSISTTPPAAPVEADTTRTLAYTGSDPMLFGTGIAAILLAGLSAAFLTVLAIRRNRRTSDEL